ncbi:TetR/AcrR family transcriptional regulator [Mucilaginibacter gynuensis]|uniref:TetR/AcrR family transcriptional regulator n=1 Tax=Mucilaginibacter gynuensis TaxID=1302236 RepID=A0ABP8HH97_9SPHI
MARLKEFIPEEKLILARNVFWEKGYSATSMDDLVKATGLARASIYHTYGDKRKLFMLCLENYFKFVESDNLSAIANLSSPKASLEKLIERVLFRTMQSGHACMGVKSGFELGSKDEQIGAILQVAAQENIHLYEQLIAQAKAEGELKSKMDAAALANIVQCYITGIGQQFALGRNAGELKIAAKNLLQSFT